MASARSMSIPSPNPGDFLGHNDLYYEPPETRGLRSDVVRIRLVRMFHTHLMDMSLAFFDEYMKRHGPRSPLLDGPPSEFLEVPFQTFGRVFV